MRRIQVCQLITELRPAGAETCVRELAVRLDRRRFDVQVAALRGGQIADDLRDAGVKVTVLDLRGKWDVLKLARLASLLRRERIDLLHTHLFHADLAGRAAGYLAGVPHLVHTVHVAEGRFLPWRFAYARLTAARCERIVCVSQSVRDDHARRSGLPARNYAVIPNGIDAARYSRDEDLRRLRRSEWGIGDGEVLFAFVGRLDPQKGVDTLLSAMSHLGARGEGVRIVLAGDGPQRHLMENYIAHGEGGKLANWLGFVRDVRGVLSAADALVMPSRWEGWPVALGEAMAAGLAVVVTRAPGIIDVIDDGQTGLLVPTDDVPQLAEAILRLSRDADLRARLGEAARRRVAEKFSIDANIAAHEELYARIAANRA